MENKTNKIFEKDALTIPDLQILLSLSYAGAAKKMRELKHQQDRLQLRGRIHKQDYFEILHLNPKDYQTSEVA